MPRLSLTGSWFHGSFHNLTTTINTSLRPPATRCRTELHAGADLQPDDRQTDHRLQSHRRGQLADQTSWTRSTRTASASTTLQPRIPRRVRATGRRSSAASRSSVSCNVNCTSPDNPNKLRFCDDAERHPVQHAVQAGGLVSAAVRHPGERVVPEQPEPVGTFGSRRRTSITTQYMPITRAPRGIRPTARRRAQRGR